MKLLITLQERIFAPLTKLDDALPLLARFAFAAVLMVYFFASGLTKLGDGLLGFLSPSTGAYAQIFPKAFEAVGYDSSQFGMFHWAVVVAGTWAEFILPVLIVLGLLARLASLGMIGFITVQSLTDLFGHGGIEHVETLGRWFDRISDSAILDQRLFWVFVLATIVIKGAGPLSLDRFITKRA